MPKSDISRRLGTGARTPAGSGGGRAAISDEKVPSRSTAPSSPSLQQVPGLARRLEKPGHARRRLRLPLVQVLRVGQRPAHITGVRARALSGGIAVVGRPQRARRPLAPQLPIEARRVAGPAHHAQHLPVRRAREERVLVGAVQLAEPFVAGVVDAPQCGQVFSIRRRAGPVGPARRLGDCASPAPGAASSFVSSAIVGWSLCPH